MTLNMVGQGAGGEVADIVTAFLRAMEQGDFAAALNLVSTDCAYINPPPFEPAKGPAGIQAVLQPFFAPVLENQFHLLRMAVHGKSVFVERLDRHRLADKWVELPVTGVFEVEAGRITYWRDYFDVATLMKDWPAL
jgi:limonene-1,2-epoxide hydrolase